MSVGADKDWIELRAQLKQAEAQRDRARELVERIYQELGDSMDKDGAWCSPRLYGDIEKYRAALQQTTRDGLGE